MIRKQDALDYHSHGRRGKIEVVSTKPCATQRDLSLAYTPGVAEPCRDIAVNPDDAYLYTAKGNLVAVVSNGTAVLGLGDIGPLAGKPVMEGKGVLFKRFADIDVFDIELNSHNPDDIIKAVQMLEPTFGGINLEDIKAPECFYIEEELKKEQYEELPKRQETKRIARRRRARAIQLAASPVKVPESFAWLGLSATEFVDVFPAACRSMSSAQSAIRSLRRRVTKRPSPLAGGRETKHAHSLERTLGPLSQSSVLRFRNQFHRFALQGKLRFKLNPYTITQPSCSGVTLPVCQRQISTASCRASATNARFFWRVAALGFNNRCPQRWTALLCG